MSRYQRIPFIIDAVQWSPAIAHPLVTKDEDGRYYVAVTSGAGLIFEGEYIVTYDDQVEVWHEHELEGRFIKIED